MNQQVMKKEVEKNRKVNVLHSFVLRLLQQVNRELIKAGAYLQEKTERYSLRQKKVALITFCFVFITLNAFVMIRSISKEQGLAFTSSRIKTIRLQKTGDGARAVPQETLIKVKGFQTYLDSLAHTERGSRIRDSLLKCRPQLLDTISYLLKQFDQP